MSWPSAWRCGTAPVLVERLPRLRGRGKHSIEYRHVIDWLVRKPGAFEEYRYRDAMFPTSRFRLAYDVLQEQRPGRAAKDYLRILDLAAKECEAGVDAVLGRLLDGERADHADRRRGALASRPGPAAGDGGRHRDGGSDDVRPVTRDRGRISMSQTIRRA